MPGGFWGARGAWRNRDAPGILQSLVWSHHFLHQTWFRVNCDSDVHILKFLQVLSLTRP